jgi:hypothetical protein
MLQYDTIFSTILSDKVQKVCLTEQVYFELVFIIIPTNGHISSVKLVLKLL